MSEADLADEFTAAARGLLNAAHSHIPIYGACDIKLPAQSKDAPPTCLLMSREDDDAVPQFRYARSPRTAGAL